MSKTVYKYNLPLVGKTRLCVTGKIIHTAMAQRTQRGDENILVWAEVGTHPHKERWLEVFGTGHQIPSGATHVSSVIDGRFVWHIYDLGSE